MGKKKRHAAVTLIIGKPKVSAKGKKQKIFSLSKHAIRSSSRKKTIRSPCSCNGENENCYKCFGTGFYDKELKTEAAKVQLTAREKNRQERIKTPADFASDSRGDEYSIRENGRFSSLPMHDNYDDESTS